MLNDWDDRGELSEMRYDPRKGRQGTHGILRMVRILTNWGESWYGKKQARTPSTFIS